MLNRSNVNYVEMMYGKNSERYSIAKQLDEIKERLNETNTVSLVKDCKMETISYIATFIDENENIHFSLKKQQKNKNSGKVKEKIIEEKFVESSKKYQILDHFIDIIVYDLLLKGYVI